MSKVEVDKVIPQSGTTLTIGDSGDTINLVGTLQSNGSPLPGDISSVVAGTGLSGGGTTGAVTINIDSAQPTITSLGTITSFRSTGIDDNADALAMTIDSAENVGIKNTTPSNFNASARQLVVGSGSGDNGITIFAGNTNNSSLFLADGTTGTNGYRGSVNYLHNGDALTLHANATETMRLTNGKVGIGTSSPAFNLDVNSGTSDDVLRLQSTDNTVNFDIKDNTSNTRIAHSQGSFSINVDRDNQVASSNLAFKIDNAEKARLTSNGQLLIGTTDAPSNSDTKLRVHVPITSSGRNAIEISQNTTGSDKVGASLGLVVDNSGSSTNAAQLTFSTASGGSLSERMRIDSSGDVGIGTTSPEVALSVLGSDTQIHFNETSASSGGYLMSEAAGQFRISGGAGFKVGGSGWMAKSTEAAIIGHDSGGDIKFFSDTSLTVGNSFTPTERMRLHSNGVISSTGGIALGVGIANTSSNVLDDYEEGTWTPAAANTSEWSGFASSTVTPFACTYTKIGRQVTIQGGVSLPDSGDSALAAGDFVQFSGLPFAYGGSGDNVSSKIPSQLFRRDGTNGGVTHGGLTSNTQIGLRVVAVHGTGRRRQQGLNLSFSYFTDA